MVYLRGDLGAGKTTLAQGFVHACGILGPVRSPTYALLQLYPLGGKTLVHLDLYRLRGAEELEQLGLTEWATPDCLWLIEWPERGGASLPPADLTVALSVGTVGHTAQLSAGTPLGEAWLARLAALRGEDCS